ncbi:hypothetical protein H9Q72_001930 [Fusarium xylarioides]|uniref:BTB domain-containing protein n=1 Tax=Fusarium xylarioides TaxID=221167 RepID=A0A9P7I154_9HYPO|nr:hypothetical protein H9Q70_012107 [Fusarium xylarioides]KAG5771624.1 hypothetical protein H9Q72_001930 [Fusarium xylarioides]
MSFRSVDAFDHSGDQRRALGNLLKTGDYSDLVIICGQERHKFHKAIICPRSDFFKAACGSGSKEAQTDEIEPRDVDPLAVSMMIEYLYHQTDTYPCDVELVRIYQESVVPFESETVPLKSTCHSVSGDASASQSLLHPMQTAVAPVPPQEPASRNFPFVAHLINYRVYAVSKKYGIAGLTALAVYPLCAPHGTWFYRRQSSP